MTQEVERRTKHKPPVKWYLLGPLTAAVSLPALMYLCAVLLAREILPFSLVEELTIACVFLSGTLSALAACAGRGGRAAQTGLAMGAVLAAAIVVITLAAPGEGPLSAHTLRCSVAAIAGGFFGGVLGMKRKNPRRRAGTRRR